MTVDDTTSITAPKWVAAGLTGLWIQTPMAIQFLFLFIVIDIATGLIASGIERKVSSDASFRGIAGKVLMLLLVATAYALPKAVGLETKFDLGASVAVLYTVNEVISILENCARAGVPIPLAFVQVLDKAKHLVKTATPADIKRLRGKK
jgi:toxin secretion/phage lysis holin